MIEQGLQVGVERYVNPPAWAITASYDYTGDIDPGFAPNMFGNSYEVDQQTGVVLSSQDWTVTSLAVDEPVPAIRLTIPGGSQVGVRLTYGKYQGTRFTVIKKLPATLTLDEFISRYASRLPAGWSTTITSGNG